MSKLIFERRKENIDKRGNVPNSITVSILYKIILYNKNRKKEINFQ